ncbi:glycosyltransferase [Calothrix sp. FACHB-1219]|uniref:glycosyltransferase n=1 Tax=unclassified Calothrix TaxID=2619626 RepID=UPI001688ED63|nr:MULTISPECIES: glycosyltransferase [unclassified Calothrix]MBD2201231.1 glycosyltransferase [Calothrix sp. FACHB-168]MBD2215665.1 glycosyltransferase [Calothrix sp. FACHB-1219]
MLTLEEVLYSQKDLARLCEAKPVNTNELFWGNFFYGIDGILKQYVGIPQEYSLKVLVPHGVYFSDSVVSEEEIDNPLSIIFCYPAYRQPAYINAIQEKQSNKIVSLASSPFLYVCDLLREISKPTRKGTIFFPAHSTFNVFAQTDFEQLAEELIHLDDKYKPVTVCIYWADFYMGRHIPFQRRGFNVVSAGYRDDPDFLFRFYHLCSMHSYAASNCLGSHIFYSVKAGCSYFHLETNTKYHWTAKSEELFHKEVPLVETSKELFLQSVFQTRQPYVTAQQMDLVNYYMGAEYFKSPLELRNQLINAENLYNRNKTLAKYTNFQETNYSKNKMVINKKFQLKTTIAAINKQTHILLYTDDSGVGGVAQYNHSILCELVGLGYQVSCVQERSSNPLLQEQKKLGVKHLWLEFDAAKDFNRTLTNTSDAQKIIELAQADLIIFSDACPFSNLAAKRVATQLEIPYIIVEGFVAPYLAERFASYLDELSHYFRQAKTVIAVSSENLSLLHTLFRLLGNKGEVIYYGRPTSYFIPPLSSVRDRLRQELGLPNDAVICFTAARLTPVKGYQYQLEAIKQLQHSSVWSKLYFVWAGAGDLEPQLRQIINQLGISDKIKLLGQRWDISDWLDASDIFVLPSEAEGMPLAVMEAMAKGLPVIASAVSGIPEELGNTGKLLVDPKENPELTIQELATTIQNWVENPEIRYSVGQAGKKRAEELFTEERMLKETVATIERALLPVGDYVSPGLSIIQPDHCFPNMIVGDTKGCQWPYLRREIAHNWYVDRRQPIVGFLSRDEAHILYNTALQFQGKRALEIGCWLGWSACHLALAGVELDVVDPLLSKPEFYESVRNSLQAAGVIDSTNLVAGYSPQKVEELADQLQRKWSLIFIDGNHDAPGPLNDAIICEQLAEPDALIIFHDLASPEVSQGLDYLKQRGWKTLVYQTMQIMGVAWRGNVQPIQHQPDPKINWQLPSHLQSYIVSNIKNYSYFQNISGDNTTEGTQLKKSPLVSVVIPCYKQARFLPQSVASVAVQTYENWEIIIVNDGRADDTNEVAQQLIKLYADKKIKLIEKDNGGLASARNVGIEVAEGEYILPLDADSKLDINCLSHLVRIVVNQSDLCVAFGSYEIFGLEQKQIISADLYSAANIKSFNMLHTSSLFSKEVWKLVGGYKTDMVAQGYEDWDFWLSCHQKNIYFQGTREITTYYRIENDSIYVLESRPNHHKLYAELVFSHPELFSVEQIRESANIILQFKNIVEDLSKFNLDEIKNIIETYQNNSQDTVPIINICNLREHIANLILSVDPENIQIIFLSNLGQVYKMLLNSGIKNEVMTSTEQAFINELEVDITKGLGQPEAIQYLLTAMLYRRADQLPLQYELTDIPQWFLDDYLKYIFESPRLFKEKGEANNYYRYLQKWLDYLQKNISSNPESALWQHIANLFLQVANFIPLYFTTENLKGIYIQRAEIMEYALKTQGYQIDYEFPERSPELQKIRLGVLAAHYTPQTETFTTLPVYKHLNRDAFEIILYTLNSQNHRLERYCSGHSDALITLPQDLSSQVKVIREDELDILLIGTNVTAVTHQITLLALHRLARIQVASTSSCVTTGMRNVDYYISGKLTEPVNDAQQQYTETLVTVDGSAHCHDFATEEHILPTITVNRESLGIDSDEIVYISGANFYKIIPEVEAAWAKIIASVPNSRLILYPFNPNWSSAYPVIEFKKRITSSFAKYGIAEERLIILNPVPNRADVKERLKIADVYLDSFPFSSINSLIDPLEVGLPTVISDGHSFRSLMGAALLRELKLEDLIADSEESYIELAIALANNPELRQQKKEQIQEKMQTNPSFLDSRSYSAKMERLFKQLFNNYLVEILSQNLPLRDINLIIFPDWTQSEESLGLELEQVIKFLATYPDSQQTTLLIDTNNIAVEDAEIFLSSVAMNLMMNEDLDITEGLEISLIEPLSNHQWQALLPNLTARITLEIEDKLALAQLPIAELSAWDWDKLMNSILEITAV